MCNALYLKKKIIKRSTNCTL